MNNFERSEKFIPPSEIAAENFPPARDIKKVLEEGEVIELSSDDLIEEGGGVGNGIIELDSSDLIEEEEDNVVELSPDDLIEVDKEEEEVIELSPDDLIEEQGQEKIDIKLTMEPRLNNVENLEMAISSSSYETSVKHTAEDTEDAVIISPDLVAVFDGAGGEGGEGAGFLASQAAKKSFEEISFSDGFVDKTGQEQKEEFMKICQEVAKKIDASGGKATASIMKIFETIDGERKIAFANFGDSAILKIKNGKSEIIIKPDDFWKTLEKQVGGNLIQAVDLIPNLNSIILAQAKAKGESEKKDAEAKIGEDLYQYIHTHKEELASATFMTDFNYKKFVDYIKNDKSIDDEKRENVIKHLSYFNKGSMAFLREKNTDIKAIDERIKIQVVDEGDVFVAASDGLLDNMAPDKIAEILSNYDLSKQSGRDTAAKEVISHLHGEMDESDEYKHDDIAFTITYIDKK